MLIFDNNVINQQHLDAHKIINGDDPIIIVGCKNVVSVGHSAEVDEGNESPWKLTHGDKFRVKLVLFGCKVFVYIPIQRDNLIQRGSVRRTWMLHQPRACLPVMRWCLDVDGLACMVYGLFTTWWNLI